MLTEWKGESNMVFIDKHRNIEDMNFWDCNKVYVVNGRCRFSDCSCVCGFDWR